MLTFRFKPRQHKDQVIVKIRKLVQLLQFLGTSSGPYCLLLHKQEKDTDGRTQSFIQ